MKNYYNESNLEKFTAELKEWKEIVNSGAPVNITISNGNAKMGLVGSVSLLPFITCPNCCKETCGKYCYAAKLAILRSSVRKSYAKNTAVAILRPDLYWIQVRAAAAGYRFFRFHVSGDIIDAAYFSEMVKTAELLPGTMFLAFTKRYSVVNDWIDKNGSLPSNLKILFSGEKNLKPVNPYNLPETTVYKTVDEFDNNWLTCGGNCFNCACAGLGCWKASAGDIVAFKEH